jgi:hypothetical protein
MYGVSGISDLVAIPGLINLDLADVRRVMTSAGVCHMGIGRASGEGRARNAIMQAINSPLLDTTIDGARGVIMNFTGGKDMKLKEVDEAASVIRDAVSPDSDIIFGAVIDPSLEDEIIITVIASGFDRDLSSPDVKEAVRSKSRAEISGDELTPETEKRKLSDVPDFLTEIGDDYSADDKNEIGYEQDGSGFMTVGNDDEPGSGQIDFNDVKPAYASRQTSVESPRDRIQDSVKTPAEKEKKHNKGLPWFLQNNN